MYYHLAMPPTFPKRPGGPTVYAVTSGVHTEAGYRHGPAIDMIVLSESAAAARCIRSGPQNLHDEVEAAALENLDGSLEADLAEARYQPLKAVPST